MNGSVDSITAQIDIFPQKRTQTITENIRNFNYIEAKNWQFEHLRKAYDADLAKKRKEKKIEQSQKMCYLG